VYSVRGRSAATAATANHAIAQLWNPHGTHRIQVVQIAIFCVTDPATLSWRVRRSTARGTAGSTVTPDIDNHFEQAIAPASGALLDLAAFGTQPTLDASELGPGVAVGTDPGAGICYAVPCNFIIPPGTGIALVKVDAVAFPASEVFFAWLEDW